jgi:hypothetical protein
MPRYGMSDFSSQASRMKAVTAEVASVEGRRVFTMTRAEWQRFRSQEGRLIGIDLERTPAGGLAEAAVVIAALAGRVPYRRLQNRSLAPLREGPATSIQPPGLSRP